MPLTRRGTTLVELLVVLVLMALLLGLVPAAIFAPNADDAENRAFVRARIEALRMGHRVTMTAPDGRRVLFLPDGRVLEEPHAR